MNNLVQIVHISRALFPVSTNAYSVEPEVLNILSKSRANNRANRLSGALCFSDGYFLQSLQGNKDSLDRVFEIIKNDSRHTEVKVLSYNKIDEKSFAKWEMKYAGIGSDIRNMLAEHGHGRFNPYIFDEEVISILIDMLKLSKEAT